MMNHHLHMSIWEFLSDLNRTKPTKYLKNESIVIRPLWYKLMKRYLYSYDRTMGDDCQAG